MSFLSRLFGSEPDPKEALRPLYVGIIRAARAPAWFRECGAEDTIDGRFEMITNVTAMVMLRMEADPELLPASARLTELFVEDMDGQLRETGLGDPTLGKKMGKMMEALGGRIGAYRDALALGPDEMAKAVERNVTLAEGTTPQAMAARLVSLEQSLAALTAEQLLSGDIPA